MPHVTLLTQVIFNTHHKAVPRSASVSFAKTLTVTEVFLFVEALSFTAIGLSFIHIVVIVPVAMFDAIAQKLSTI